MRDLGYIQKEIEAASDKVETIKKARALRQQLARATMGTSPASVLTLLNDWALHLALAPDKQLELFQHAQDNWMAWARYVFSGCPENEALQPTRPQKGDHRFQHPAWQKGAYAALMQAFLLAEEFADQASGDVPGLSPGHDRAMKFLMRQTLDAVAPTNFLLSNPEALERTFATRGENLVKGAQALWQDVHAAVQNEKNRPESRVGRDLAMSPGKVVLRTHLMELIQYAPTTETVHPEPILIVPAWIMKYYVLDLSPENSLVRYLTEQGFTVYMISWRNPQVDDAECGMADYLDQGPRAAIDHITAQTNSEKVHGVGYCLGGTLLSIAAADMARTGDGRLCSMTLLAAQTDFSEAGELMLFINESQVSFLEDVMAAQGYLEAGQMMSAFQLLRSNDLVWSRIVRRYQFGEPEPQKNDLMAWNADTTRMPARMHSEYLRQMFLNNDLAAGRYLVDGHAVSLRDIRIPVFGVGTETDHIAPWKSVFKIHNLGHADVTFALTNGGHNAGVISEPGHARRHFRLHTIRDKDRALAPEDWIEVAALHEGSWWPAWIKWLREGSAARTAPPAMSGDICDAPGSYVLMA